MELKDALLNRRSIRKFLEKEVEKEKIEELLHAAMSGPSACNKTPWEFYVITNKDKLQELKKSTPFTKMDSPLAIVVVGNMLRALPLTGKEFWVQDCSAATENILLRATDLSLGALWCGIYPNKGCVEKLSKILDLEKHKVPLNIIYVGYPDEEKDPRDQYEEKYVHYID